MRADLALLVSHRLGFGPRGGLLQELARIPLARYVDEQLRPESGDDAETVRRLKSARLRIEYEAGAEDGKSYPARKESRALTALDLPASRLWRLADSEKAIAYEERVRPAAELRVAAVLRAVHSRSQLREVLVDFWHNHFNVNAFADEKIAALFPVYDREVIRAHALGNFREMLEAVAKSPAMAYYLNNASSRASPANENYARELFELHTLGAESYLNSLYNRWRDVPGAREGRPVGYIDQDVYEAARAFTGWTVADGTDTGRGTILPNTGEFHYFDGWHDNYQKRVLGVEFDPNRPPMEDGQRVLDLVAFHPATARHVCRKLCRRLVADEPAPALVELAAEVWRRERDSPDQIARVVRTIVLSDDFASSSGKKVKRPLELVASLARALDARVSVGDDLIGSLAAMGQRLFEWPTPNGHPDAASAWLTPGALLRRWNTIAWLSSEDGMSNTFAFDARAGLARAASRRRALDLWSRRLLGRAPGRGEAPAAKWFLGEEPDASLEPGEDSDGRLRSLVALLASSPAFQVRG